MKNFLSFNSSVAQTHDQWKWTLPIHLNQSWTCLTTQFVCRAPKQFYWSLLTWMQDFWMQIYTSLQSFPWKWPLDSALSRTLWTYSSFKCQLLQWFAALCKAFSCCVTLTEPGTHLCCKSMIKKIRRIVPFIRMLQLCDLYYLFACLQSNYKRSTGSWKTYSINECECK